MSRALSLAAAMQRAGCGIKLGLEFFGAQGPAGIKEIRRACEDVPLFLDLKFHDIPNTVAGALRAVTALEPAYVNVHASGGRAMMEAGLGALAEAADKIGVAAPRLLAVTVLTSLDAQDLQEAGITRPVEEQVKSLALLTRSCGLAGVVCAPQETGALRAACGNDFVLMTPGIRPAGADGKDDQKRTMTPAQAMAAGATHLVIGRPITGAPDPAAAAIEILQGIVA